VTDAASPAVPGAAASPAVPGTAAPAETVAFAPAGGTGGPGASAGSPPAGAVAEVLGASPAVPANAAFPTRSPASKPRYWSRQSPPGPWDTIVIGSGMGGMTCAAILALLGERVLVLEQHYVPGGFTHSFTRRRYHWDVGVHAIGEVTEKSLSGRLLARLAGPGLRWASLGPVYDSFDYPGGLKIDFPDSPEQFRANLVAAFPQERDGIDRYLSMVRDAARAMRGFYLARAAPPLLAPLAEWWMGRKARPALELTVRDATARCTADERLRTVLAAQWGYYGAPPSRASFGLHALVVRHFLHGAWYPVGGAQEISRGLLKTVADRGGWTRLQADVQEVLVERGRAAGVRLAGGEVLRAPRVVSAAGVLATARRMLPESCREAAWTRELEGLRPGPAHLCLYLGFKGDIRAAGAGSANRWFYRTWDAEEETWRVDGWQGGSPLPEAPVLYCSFPSLKDPEHDPGPEQRHTGEVVTFAPWDAFSRWRESGWRKRGEDYDRFKADLQARMLAQFFEHMPALKPLLDFVDLSTPLSTDHFCRPVAGSIYGLEPTPERFRCARLRPRSPIPGLFFAGSDVASGGVMGAMGGGILAAIAARPWDTVRLLRGV